MLKFSRLLLIYLIAGPLAVFIGVLVSNWDFYSTALIALIVSFLILPVLLRWHHAFLIFFWNSAFNAYFLPGSPDCWLLFSMIGFGIAMLNHIIFQRRFLRAPHLTVPLLVMAAVVLGTAFYRGGIGIKALGGTTYGGRYYIFILGAIAGYFALTSQSIPISKAKRAAALFFLPGISYAVSNLAYFLGPAFYFIYYLIPPTMITAQVATDWGVGDIDRILGLASACVAILCFLMAKYGIRGLFDWTKPWRFVFLFLTIATSLFAGFRSVFALICMMFAFQFYFEGMMRTAILPVSLVIAFLTIVPVVLFSGKLPNTVQRTLSFLPIKIPSDVREDARASSEWRFEMWRVVAREVPKYLVIGKGYGIDPTEMFLLDEGARMGLVTSYEQAMLAGDYHSGPLSVIIPFGIPGAVAFLWVLGGGGHVLYRNYRYGDPRLKRMNSVLLSFYLAYVVSFFFIFGALATQLYYFLGAAGLSVSLNGGVCKKPLPRREFKPLRQIAPNALSTA